MPTNDGDGDLRRDLTSALKDLLDIEEAGTLSDLLQSRSKEGREPAVFLARRPGTALLVAEHFEIKADLVILYRRVRTLGLVQILSEASDLEKTVRESVDHATYLRHLLVSDQRRGQSVPLAVELVLAAPWQEGVRAAIGRALSGVARQTDYLHAIGVNELYHKGEPFDPDSLRRAFPWLLRATDHWIGRPGKRPAWRLKTLELDHYRLPGRRILNLAEGHRLHLVHGHNGSGKSTLAEALELLLTGQIERLDAVKGATYADVLTHRGSTQPPRIILDMESVDGQSPPPGPEVREARRDPAGALSPDLRVTGFRLDQTLMDRLSRLGDEQRAVTFLESFFPEERDTYRKFRQVERRLGKALDSLGGIVALPSPRPEGQALADLLSPFAGVESSSETPTPELFDRVLPLPLADLLELARVAPALRSVVEPWKTSRPPMDLLPDELARLDENLAAVQGEILKALNRLRPAWEILRGMEGWVASPKKAAGKDPAARLNAWLELCALVDLADKQLQLARSLTGALEKGWKAEPTGAGLLLRAALNREEIAQLESRRADWIKERDSLGREVRNLRRRPGAAERRAEATASAPLPQLSKEQIAILDAIGPDLLPAQEVADTAPFGTTLNDSIISGNELAFGNLPIGSPDWFEKLRSNLEPLLRACARAESMLSAPRTADRFRNLKKAVQLHRELSKLRERVDVSFIRQLVAQNGVATDRSLDQAVNELMALFTPTRWAYEDVGLAYEDPEQRDLPTRLLLTLRGGSGPGARADLFLNTAELNIFTLALFLLCSVRTGNRLGLLVLDDPLQNMDELTVTTVARGLSKLVDVLPGDWQLLLLFHGEDDLERFRREVPGAVYLLPWLAVRPTDPGNPEIIATQASTGTDLQPLDALLSEVSRETSPRKVSRQKASRRKARA